MLVKKYLFAHHLFVLLGGGTLSNLGVVEKKGSFDQ